MTVSQDVELQQLFAGEIHERAARLSEGARRLALGDVDDSLLGDMYREGHTIKGTARMMGFTAVSDAGKLIEDAWRGLRDGEIEASPALAEALESLAEGLVPAIAADPASGTPQLAAGVRAVRREALVDDVLAPTDDPDKDGTGSDQGDLGGLLGTLDSFAFGESLRVNAAGMFQVINEICSLRVDTEVLGELVADLIRNLHDREALEVGIDRLTEAVGSADNAVADLQARALDLSAAPLAEITNTFPQFVRYLSRKAGKEIRFELVGDEHHVDRQVLERLSDPLRHLLVNAVHHGIEEPDERTEAGKPRTATLALRAELADHRLTLVVEDDGRGVDWEAVQRAAARREMLPAGNLDADALRPLLFAPRFSTATPGDLVGDGMGLATVAQAVESLHGTITFDTRQGEGTRVVITVPVSRALQDAVLITAAGQTWGLPEIAVLDRLPVERVEIVDRGSRRVTTWQGNPIPVVSFAEAVGLGEQQPPRRMLVVSSPTGPVGFLVESVIGRRQVAARELGPILDGVPHLTGAALLGGGDVVVIVDPSRLAERARDVERIVRPRRRVLVVDDSRGARQIVGGALGSAGFEVDLAGSPTEALSVLAEQTYDAIVLDYVLPTMDGATLVRKVREIGIRAPVVMLSGAATAEDRGKAFDAGANAFLDKDDVRQGALAALIEELVAAF